MHDGRCPKHDDYDDHGDLPDALDVELLEREAQAEYASLGMMSYYGGRADLDRADIELIRNLIRRLADDRSNLAAARSDDTRELRDVLAERDALAAALQNLVDACQSGHSGMPGGYSIRAPYRSHVDQALAALSLSAGNPA